MIDRALGDIRSMALDHGKRLNFVERDFVEAPKAIGPLNAVGSK